MTFFFASDVYGDCSYLFRDLTRRARLTRALEVGLDADGGMGFHGTSVETLRIAFETGYLPLNLEKWMRGRLYFSSTVPHPDAKTESHPSFHLDWGSKKDAAKWMSGYAEISAKKIYTIDQLGFSRDVLFSHERGSNNAVSSAANELFGRGADYLFASDSPSQNSRLVAESLPWFQSLTTNGHQFDDIHRIRREAKKRKGIVLVFSADTFEQFSVRNGLHIERADTGSVILFPEGSKGLPIELIVGIEVYSEAEWNELQELLN